MISLRPYQVEGIQRIRDAIEQGQNRVLAVAATGAGKTVIACSIMTSALALGVQSLFVAPRREIIAQTYRKLIEAGARHEDVGVILAGVENGAASARPGDPWRHASRRPWAPMQVASIDTLRNRPKPKAGLVFLDEAHRSIAPSYQALLENYPDANVIGLTATPFNRDFSTVYGQLVVVASPAELMDLGFLVRPRGWTVPAESLPDLSKVKVRGGDYDEGELADACNQAGLVGDIVETWKLRANGMPTVAFAVSVAHSKHIVERFVAAGVPAEHLDGETDAETRARILERLKTGETKVVANCAVLCLDEQTEILTLEGWRSIDTMQPTDHVANWDDGEVTFEVPSEIVRRHRAPGERMVVGSFWWPDEATDRPDNIRVTEGHGMLSRKADVDRCGRGFTKRPARDLVGESHEFPSFGDGSRPKIATLQFEDGWTDERVWCVKTRTKNIITRRGGKVVVMGNCEGWDSPSVACCIMARPTKSKTLYIQCVGRVLRPCEGKEGAIILDHAGCIVEHGMPQHPPEYELVAKKRKGKGDDCAKQCPQCFELLELGALTCPGCGFEFPPRKAKPLVEKSGELVEFNNELKLLTRWEKLVAAWRSENERRMAKPEGRPRYPAWLRHEWKKRTRLGGLPKGAKLPTLLPEEIERIERIDAAAAKVPEGPMTSSWVAPSATSVAALRRASW